MKKTLAIFLAALTLFCALSGCAGKVPAPSASGGATDLRFEGDDSPGEPRTLEEICAVADAVVRARVTEVDTEFSPDVIRLTFEVLDDYYSVLNYTAMPSDSSIYVVEATDNFYMLGEVYYLFMTAENMVSRPYISYTSGLKEFKVREADGKLEFLMSSCTLGLKEDDDLDAMIKELASKNKKEPNAFWVPELDSYMEAAEYASEIWKIELISHEDRGSKVAMVCDLYLREVVKGEREVSGDPDENQMIKTLLSSPLYEDGKTYLLLLCESQWGNPIVFSRDYFLVPEGTEDYDAIMAKYG